jgi:phage gpG-like protein
MVRISFVVDGQAQFDRAFNRVGNRIKDLRPVFEEVGKEFKEIQAEQFASEGAKGFSGAWQPLSANYAILKQAIWGSKPILEASGRLKESLTTGHADTVEEIRKDSAAFGTTVPYATQHQRGNASKRLPKREVISFSDRQKRRLQKRIQATLLELMRQDGEINKFFGIE